MRVKCVLINNTYYIIYDADTEQEVGTAANDLNMKLQCRSKKWSLTNPPKQKKARAKSQG